MLDYFEEEYGSAEVAAVLSMIQVSHKGMLEEEICALLPRIPACLQDQDQQGIECLYKAMLTALNKNMCC